MMDASGLIDALGRDDLDQRAVADHLVVLAKVRGKNAFECDAKYGVHPMQQ